jgi:hypothetical protein
MALRIDHTCGKPLTHKLSKVPIRVVEGLECSMNSAHDTHSLEHKAGNHLLKDSGCSSGLVFTIHMHDGFECMSPRDYIDTKSYLAYEQNPYSTH